MHKVEYELLQKTDEPPAVLEEERVEYLRRLVRAAAQVDDNTWESFSEETVLWTNHAIDMMNDMEDPEDFYTFFGLEEGDDQGIMTADEARRKAKEEKQRQPDKRFDHRHKRKRKPGRKPTKKAQGSSQRAKQLFIQNPDMDIDELLAQLIREGHQMSRSTLVSVRAELRNTLKVLNELGLLAEGYYGF